MLGRGLGKISYSYLGSLSSKVRNASNGNDYFICMENIFRCMSSGWFETSAKSHDISTLVHLLETQPN